MNLDLTLITDAVQSFLQGLLDKLPIEVFIFVGSFLEEIIAPIPSPFVTTASGTAAAASGYPFFMLFILAVMGAFGKVLGSLVIYKIADLGEDIIVHRFGKLLGLTKSSIEKIGSKFHKGGRDIWVLLGLRSLPIVPSSPISAVCGLIKMPLKTFIIAGLVGNSIRNFIFLYFGYTGIAAYKEILSGIDGLESIMKIVSLVAIIVLFGWIFLKRKKQNKALIQADIPSTEETFVPGES